MEDAPTIMQDQILDAAIRRFSYFGASKTTMTEVAEDLSLTKQALAYHFHDKQSLIKAVEEKILREYFTKLEAELNGIETVEDKLLKLVEVKFSFFEKYYMMASHAENQELISTRTISEWRTNLRELEMKTLIPVLEKGISTGELKPIDPGRTANLLLDTLYAFARCVKDKTVLPDADAFKEVFEKQQELIRIFYQGIKTEQWKKR